MPMQVKRPMRRSSKFNHLLETRLPNGYTITTGFYCEQLVCVSETLKEAQIELIDFTPNANRANALLDSIAMPYPSYSSDQGPNKGTTKRTKQNAKDRHASNE